MFDELRKTNNHGFFKLKGWENQEEEEEEEEDQEQVKDFEGNGFRGKHEPEN